jgi:hypothetical protein
MKSKWVIIIMGFSALIKNYVRLALGSKRASGSVLNGLNLQKFKSVTLSTSTHGLFE